MRRLSASTSQLTSLKVSGGDVQLVRFKDHLGLDVQAVHTRVDGKRVRDHAFLMLALSEMRDPTLAQRVDFCAEVAPVDQSTRPSEAAA
jgi:hypothetical protein